MNGIVPFATSASAVDDWAARISATWRQSVEFIIETGRLIAQAKAELSHGQFTGMIEQRLPFGPRQAQRLMAIASDPRLTDATHASYLPPHASTLYELTKLDDDEFDARLMDGTINPETERSEITALLKRERRADRLAEIAQIAEVGTPELPTGKFPIIYADPPWRFEVFSRETGLQKSPDQHYPTMTMEEICALPVSDLVPEDALLFLWITSPMLNRMDDIFRAWGRIERIDPEYGPIRQPWRYVTNYCWDKVHIAPGYWNRNQHEHLLIAKIGDVPAPPPSELVPSVYAEPRTVHSAKPDYFAMLIDKHFPDLPKIELFRRGSPRNGWACWGNQAIQEAA